jgi:hypothetical protein
VRERLDGHLLGRDDVATVAHPQASPVEPADAATAVAPGNPGPEGQLGGGVDVGAVPFDLGPDLLDPWPDRPRPGVLSFVESQELLRRGGIDLNGKRAYGSLPPRR